MVLATYEERLTSGDVEIKDVVVSKRITREPRDYQKAGVTAIATQQLFGSGSKLRPGQNIEYIITDSQSDSSDVGKFCGFTEDRSIPDSKSR
jgi:DNA polymerase elongation subunit (family B)